jgi:hypothetical protein
MLIPWFGTFVQIKWFYRLALSPRVAMFIVGPCPLVLPLAFFLLLQRKTVPAASATVVDGGGVEFTSSGNIGKGSTRYQQLEDAHVDENSLTGCDTISEPVIPTLREKLHCLRPLCTK